MPFAVLTQSRCRSWTRPFEKNVVVESSLAAGPVVEADPAAEQDHLNTILESLLAVDSVIKAVTNVRGARQLPPSNTTRLPTGGAEHITRLYSEPVTPNSYCW